MGARRQKERVLETALPLRNFSLNIHDWLRATAAGPPAYVRRRRRIEDLEELVLEAIATEERKTGAPLDLDALPLDVTRPIDQLNALIEKHNRYYPIEANLPIDPQTGALFDHGKAWEPMPRVTAASLRLRLG